MIKADVEQQLWHRVNNRIGDQAELRIQFALDIEIRSQCQMLIWVWNQVEDQLETDFKRFKRLTRR